MPKRRVLLVEDDLDIARMYVLGLETAGYEVSSVVSGETALAVLARQLPDVVILDWNLPGMGGDELFEILRASRRTRQVPLMFLSNYPRSESKIAGVVVGGNPVPWLVKAETTPVDLAHRLGELLGSFPRRPTSPTAA